MTKILAAISAAFVLTCVSPASAKPSNYTGYHYCNDFFGTCVKASQRGFKYRQTQRHKYKKHMKRSYKAKRVSVKRVGIKSGGSHTTQFMPHPVGCPSRAFCGCGVSQHVFGKSFRDLWLAANWLIFPRAEPAAGMVAARRGHVFAILEYLGKNMVLAYDPNSGGRKTRIHKRSLRGFKVVNPHGSSKYAAVKE